MSEFVGRVDDGRADERAVLVVGEHPLVVRVLVARRRSRRRSSRRRRGRCRRRRCRTGARVPARWRRPRRHRMPDGRGPAASTPLLGAKAASASRAAIAAVTRRRYRRVVCSDADPWLVLPRGRRHHPSRPFEEATNAHDRIDRTEGEGSIGRPKSRKGGVVSENTHPPVRESLDFENVDVTVDAAGTVFVTVSGNTARQLGDPARTTRVHPSLNPSGCAGYSWAITMATIGLSLRHSRSHARPVSRPRVRSGSRSSERPSRSVSPSRRGYV